MEEKLLDVGAERAVLSGLLQHGIDGYINVDGFITRDSFVHVNNKMIFACIEDVISNDQTPDISTILASAEKLKVVEQLSTKQELKYLQTLYDFPIMVENILGFAIQIKKFEFARNIRKLTDKVHSDVGKIDGTESVDEIIRILEDPVTDFLREDDGGENPEKIGEGIEDYVKFLEENK